MPPIDTTPDYPAQPEDHVESAARDLPAVLEEMENETGYGASDPGRGHRIVQATRLVEELSAKRGHSRAVAAWAIHRLVQRGMLVPEIGVEVERPVIGYRPDEERTVVKARRFFGSVADSSRYQIPVYGEPVRKPLAPADRPVPYDCLLVRSTPALWEWRLQATIPTGPVFTETDFDRALSALDLCLQDYAWQPGDNYLTLESLEGALKAKDITLALATELLCRLIDAKVFTPWSQTIPAGSSYEEGCSLPILRLEPETTHCLVTTRERWYSYLADHRRRRGAEKNQSEQPTAPRLSQTDLGRIADSGPADAHNTISSVEEYLRLEKLYKEAGKPFNPALEKGSPAAAHVIAQHGMQEVQASRGENVHVGIVVPLDEEFRELFQQIKERCQVVPDPDTGRSFYLFEQPSSDPKTPYRCVATFIGEMGHPKAALVTEKLVSRWAPATVVMLGIAGGLSKDVALGDVVVAVAVDSYLERSKATQGKRKAKNSYQLRLAGEVYRCSADLSTRLQHFEFSNDEAHQRWSQRCFEGLEALLTAEQRAQLIEGGLLRPNVVLKTGHVASGPTVGSAKSYTDWLKQRDRSYLALEMEGGGLMAALSDKADPKKSLILRGISDYADERKEELDKIQGGGLRRYAMRNAIYLLWALLESGALPR